MPEWREITDRREPVGTDRVRLWFDVGPGPLRSATINRAMQNEATIRAVGEALAAEWRPPPKFVYGDGADKSDRG